MVQSATFNEASPAGSTNVITDETLTANFNADNFGSIAIGNGTGHIYALRLAENTNSNTINIVNAATYADLTNRFLTIASNNQSAAAGADLLNAAMHGIGGTVTLTRTANEVAEFNIEDSTRINDNNPDTNRRQQTIVLGNVVSQVGNTFTNSTTLNQIQIKHDRPTEGYQLNPGGEAKLGSAQFAGNIVTGNLIVDENIRPASGTGAVIFQDGRFAMGSTDSFIALDTNFTLQADFQSSDFNSTINREQGSVNANQGFTNNNMVYPGGFDNTGNFDTNRNWAMRGGVLANSGFLNVSGNKNNLESMYVFFRGNSNHTDNNSINLEELVGSDGNQGPNEIVATITEANPGNFNNALNNNSLARPAFRLRRVPHGVSEPADWVNTTTYNAGTVASQQVDANTGATRIFRANANTTGDDPANNTTNWTFHPNYMFEQTADDNNKVTVNGEANIAIYQITDILTDPADENLLNTNLSLIHI